MSYMNLSNAILGPFILLIFATSCSTEFYSKRTFFSSLFSPFPPQTQCMMILLDIPVLVFWGIVDIDSLRVFFDFFFYDFCRPVWQSQTFPEWRILISSRKEAALHFLQFLLSFFNVFSSFAVFFFRWYNHNVINAQLVHGELQ